MVEVRAMGLSARSIVDTIGLIVPTVATAFLVATIGQPLRINWGDPWTDCNALITGRFFSKYGFVNTAFTPIIDVEPLKPDSLRYTHYPPLPDIMNGLQQDLHGDADISVFRAPAIVLSLLALYLFFRWVQRLWGSAVANVAVAFFAGNLLWVQYADTINHIPLYSATGYGALLCAARWMSKRKKRDLALVGILTFACFLSSYDFVFFVPIMAAATPLVLGERLWTPNTLKLFAVVVVGAAAAFVVKQLLVIWAVGWPQFYGDFVFQFHERATTQYGGDYKSAFPRIILFRLWRVFTPLFFVVVAVHVVLLAMRLARRTTPAKWSASPLFVLLAGAPFILVFSQLFCDQYHPTLVLLPYYAIGAAMLVVRLWESPGAKQRAAAVALLIFGLGWQLREIATFPKTFLTRSDVSRVRAVLDDHHQFVLSNGVTVAPTLYYWNRYDLSISYLPPEVIPAYVISLQDQFGEEPIRYVHFANIEKSIFDKYVYTVFIGAKKFDWIARPAARADEWQPVVRARDEAFVAYIAKFAELELDTGTTQVFRLDRHRIFDFFAKQVMASPTTFVDFGLQSSDAFKVYGIRYSEKYGAGQGFAWTERRQPGRYMFTLKGLVVVPTAAPRDDAALRLFMPAGRRYRVVVSLLAAVNGQVVAASINASPELARLALDTGDPKELTVDVPPEALDPSGLQTLRLQMTKASDAGVGVALRTLRVTAE
jgi:hypothetical protein